MDDLAPRKPPLFDGMVLSPFKPLREDAKKRFEEIRNLECRVDDIILATYPKSGTHWIWEVVCMLINGNTEYVKEPKEFMFLEAIPDFSVLQNIQSPRPLNTHIPYRWMPKQHIENGGKIIHVIRNPKDVAVSFYHHLVSAGEFNKDFTFEQYLNKIFLGPARPMGGWYNYVKEFERATEKDERSAILTVYYENMKKSPIEETKRVAKFLKIEASDKLIEDIVDKCSFKNLKAADASIKDQSYMDKIMDLGNMHRLSKPIMYRKGVIGDWKNHFTVALNERFDREFTEEMKNSRLHIQFE